MKLSEKFDNDMKKRSRLKRLFLSVDQFLNVLFWNGSQDETVSSHLYRRIESGKATKFDKRFCQFLRNLEAMHCFKSRGE